MRKKLLLVEDDASVLASLNLCLKAHYEIHTASTVRLGIDYFRSLRPSLVVLDLRLPDGNGLDALREIRSGGSTTPVIVLTGYASMDSIESALRLGASDYLRKPFDAFVLKARIDELIALVQRKASPSFSLTSEDSSMELDFSELQQIGISRRECEVLHWIAQGKRDLEIAIILSISVRTVHHHVSAILKKLGVETRTAAAAVAANVRVDPEQGNTGSNK